jgi:hypothetical protein
MKYIALMDVVQEAKQGGGKPTDAGVLEHGETPCTGANQVFAARHAEPRRSPDSSLHRAGRKPYNCLRKQVVVAGPGAGNFRLRLLQLRLTDLYDGAEPQLIAGLR